MPQLSLDHVGIAVPSLAEAIPVWERLTGGESYGHERVEAQGVEVVFVGRGAGRLELLAPLGEGTPVARYLERRGAGVHHLAYRVDDVDRALEALAAEGYELIDRSGRVGAHGRTVAFLHPRAAGGVLVELLS